MPQFKLPGFGQAQVEAEGGSFKTYEGPLPPKNKRTRVRVKGLKIKINSAGNNMLTCVAEIDAPKGHPMHQYNGAAAFWNGNLTEQGAGWVNEFLQAIAGSATLGKKLSEALWVGKHGGIRLIGAKEPTKDGVAIGAIGTVKFAADKTTHAEIITAHGKITKGDRKGEIVLNVGSWVLPKKVDETPADEEADEDDEDTGVEEDDEEDEGSEDDEDESDEDDEDDEDSDEEDEEDEEDGSEGYSKEPPF